MLYKRKNPRLNNLSTEGFRLQSYFFLEAFVAFFVVFFAFAFLAAIVLLQINL